MKGPRHIVTCLHKVMIDPAFNATIDDATYTMFLMKHDVLHYTISKRLMIAEGFWLAQYKNDPMDGIRAIAKDREDQLLHG